MNPITIGRMLLARRALIAMLMLLGALGGLVVAKLMPDNYQATARLLVDALKPDPVTNEALPPRTVDTFIKTQAELIRDYRITGAVVDGFGWTKMPQLQAAYAKRSSGEDLDIRQWLAKRVGENTVAYMEGTQPILAIAYTAPQPEVAQRVVEMLRTALIEQTIAAKRQQAAQNAQWFNRQTEQLKIKLAAAEARKASFEKANGIILGDDNVDAESAKLRALAGAAAVPSMPSAPAMPVTAPSQGQLAGVEAQLATGRASLGPNHPEIQALERQRAALAAAVSRELAAGRAAAAPRSSGPSAAAQYDQQVQKVLAQRGLIGQAQRLAGEVTVLRDQVAKTAQRTADFELQAQTTESGFQPIGPVATPAEPLSPALWMFIVAGLVAGAAIGILVALLLEFLFRRVRGEEDLMLENVPLIGSMSDRSRKSGGLLSWLRVKEKVVG